MCLELLRRHPGASNSERARGTVVTRQTMSTLLRGLQDRGLNERPATAPSGRSLPTTLPPPEGNSVLNDATADIQAIEQRTPLHDAPRELR